MGWDEVGKLCQAIVFVAAWLAGTAQEAVATAERAQSENAAVTIRQLQGVEQGGSGWFAIEIAPGETRLPITLRLRREIGTGAAAFDDGSAEKRIQKSETVQVWGLVASDLLGRMALTAWPDGAMMPTATAWFDVLPPKPAPRLFMGGRDITGETVLVAMGQQIALNATLHPGLQTRSMIWEIDPPGEYVGGFLHTPEQGGPQPVLLQGPSTVFYWVAPGSCKTVTFRVTMPDGGTAQASAMFEVDGPSSTEVAVSDVEVQVGPGKTAGTSYMTFGGAGINFRAQYDLPERLVKNFTWVQLILDDTLLIKSKDGELVCSPKVRPVAELGVALDSGYPYDTHNPTKDSPPVELNREGEELSREFHARMYLLWNSGLTNSIEVPLGYVAWHFGGRAVRTDEEGNHWTLKSGSGGVDDKNEPFKRVRIYPVWNRLVPYMGVLVCD